MDIKQKTTKCDLKHGIDNRDEIGCGPNVALEDCNQYIRHIVVPEAEYSIIRDSKETRYPGAIIVVETNVPIVRNIATALMVLKQSVVRYWYDQASQELKMEELFFLQSTEDHPIITDILVFDSLAVFITGTTPPSCPKVSPSKPCLSLTFTYFTICATGRRFR